jgi:hypothetical protein
MRSRIAMTETAASRSCKTAPIPRAILLGAALLGAALTLLAATPGQAQQPRYLSDWSQAPAASPETVAPARAEGCSRSSAS